MFDFTEGSTWFLSGFGVMLFLVVLVLLFVLIARKVEHR
jgi:hypothetical protein